MKRPSFAWRLAAQHACAARRLFGCVRDLSFFRRDLRFKFFPPRLRKAINADDPSGCAGVNAAVERLVAFPELLPF